MKDTSFNIYLKNTSINLIMKRHVNLKTHHLKGKLVFFFSFLLCSYLFINTSHNYLQLSYTKGHFINMIF